MACREKYVWSVFVSGSAKNQAAFAVATCANHVMDSTLQVCISRNGPAVRNHMGLLSGIANRVSNPVVRRHSFSAESLHWQDLATIGYPHNPLSVVSHGGRDT